MESRRLKDSIRDWREHYGETFTVTELPRKKSRFGVSRSQPAVAVASASEPGVKGMASVPPATINGRRNWFAFPQKVRRNLLR